MESEYMKILERCDRRMALAAGRTRKKVFDEEQAGPAAQEALIFGILPALSCFVEWVLEQLS